MDDSSGGSNCEPALVPRSNRFYRQRKERVYREADQLFGLLLLVELGALVILAFFDPANTGGAQADWIVLPLSTRIFLGVALILGPVGLAFLRPGLTITRYSLATVQMMLSLVLARSDGECVEFDFYVFCSLIILSFYRDWRVFVPAVVAACVAHFLRGYEPNMIFEAQRDSFLRSFQLFGWLIFEAALLGIWCLQTNKEMCDAATQSAALQEQTTRLATSQQVNQLLVANSHDVCCLHDSEGRFLTVNPACTRLWGYKIEEIIGKLWTEIVHPDDRERSRLASAGLMAGHAVTDFESRFVRKDGSIAHVLWSACRSEGDSTIFQVVRDISESKETEAALHNTNRQLASALQANQLIMDNSQDVICALDAKGQFLSTNAACHLLWGYRPEELIGRCYLALVSPEDRTRTKQIAEATRCKDKITNFVNRCLRQDGSTVDVLWSATWSAADEILFCVAHDVTESQRIEKELREAKEVAERANRAKSEFLSRMSHELRTPLNAILGFGQLLERQNPPPAQEQHLHRILTAGRHLLRLINEVLDISRIESEKLSLSLEPVSISLVLEEAGDLIQPLALEHSIHLFTPPSSETSFFVQADHQRLKQVLLNLLNNAVKYTPAGGSVIVSCARLGEKVRISVHDTGVGIAQNKLARAFTPFDRLGAEQSPIEGTGLGLALSRGLVHAMGGVIGVESIEGQGTTFWLELVKTDSPLSTLAVEDGETSRGNGDGDVKQRSVLYIEDNLSNLKLIEHLLAEASNLHLISAMQGSIGLDIARQHLPDVILLDLHLPDMPGWEVLTALKESKTTRHIPTVIVSADATPGQCKRLLDAGARNYITKPFEVPHFYQVMNEIARELECVGA